MTVKPTHFLNQRRSFLKQVGAASAAFPFLANLTSVASAEERNPTPQRIVWIFSPNGTVPREFWPDESGNEITFKRILEPLTPFQDRMLTVKGISNRIRGDGDGHMRGMSCLLTAIELFPGNIQGGSDTPAGWASGISIDQEIRNFLQSNPQTQSRFGSLTLGVAVPNRADPWTRWSYAGPNKPVSLIDDPYQLFEKLYGTVKDREALTSVLDDLSDDLRRVRNQVSQEDARLLEEHLQLVRDMEHQLHASLNQEPVEPIEIPEGVPNENDSIPQLSRMQMNMLSHALQMNMARVATLQFTNSVGNARMKWLDIEEGHHSLSHESDQDTDSQEKLIKINHWYCQQVAYLAEKLDSIPEPDGSGTLLDNTTIIWTNELGKGNSHTLNNIPFVMVGGGLRYRMGRALQFDDLPHNRLWLSVAHAMGHKIDVFGKPELCGDGLLPNLV